MSKGQLYELRQLRERARGTDAPTYDGLW